MLRIRESVYGVKAESNFGKWTVLGPAFTNGKSVWNVVVRCVCGRVAVTQCNHLAAGETTQCKGCHAAESNTKHGGCRSKANGGQQRLFNIWKQIKSRCNSSSCPAYPNYGGRGIRLCDEWAADFAKFRSWSLENGYAANLEIDRRDNDGNYEPGNCRWVTRQINANNMRTNRHITAFGETKTVADWTRDSRCNVSFQILYKRVVTFGWNPERALTLPRTKDGRNQRTNLQVQPARMQ